jgi:hypothetical protein
MRVAIPLLAALVVSSARAGPEVDAHISRDDVRQICAAVSRVTREPVRLIDAEISDKYVRGSIPQNATKESSGGHQTQIKIYERTDLVDVEVGDPSHQSSGVDYYVQKFGDKWKLVGKGHWIR